MAKDILQHRYRLTVKHELQVRGRRYNEMWTKEKLRETLRWKCYVIFIYVCVSRGVIEGRQGWSVLLKEPAQWVELEGSDYVLDLMSDLELPADFPKHSSYFIISAQEPSRVRANASM